MKHLAQAKTLTKVGWALPTNVRECDAGTQARLAQRNRTHELAKGSDQANTLRFCNFSR